MLCRSLQSDGLQHQEMGQGLPGPEKALARPNGVSLGPFDALSDRHRRNAAFPEDRVLSMVLRATLLRKKAVASQESSIQLSVIAMNSLLHSTGEHRATRRKIILSFVSFSRLLLSGQWWPRHSRQIRTLHHFGPRNDVRWQMDKLKFF